MTCNIFIDRKVYCSINVFITSSQTLYYSKHCSLHNQFGILLYFQLYHTCFQLLQYKKKCTDFEDNLRYKELLGKDTERKVTTEASLK